MGTGSTRSRRAGVVYVKLLMDAKARSWLPPPLSNLDASSFYAGRLRVTLRSKMFGQEVTPMSKRMLVVSLTCLVLWPQAARAQSSGIEGTVVDATGGVLPGVTVEISGAALPDGVTAAFTDEAGRYSVSLPGGHLRRPLQPAKLRPDRAESGRGRRGVHDHARRRNAHQRAGGTGFGGRHGHGHRCSRYQSTPRGRRGQPLDTRRNGDAADRRSVQERRGEPRGDRRAEQLVQLRSSRHHP